MSVESRPIESLRWCREVHKPRTSQSSGDFSVMLFVSSRMSRFSVVSRFLFVLIVLKLVHTRCDMISPRDVAVYIFEVWCSWYIRGNTSSTHISCFSGNCRRSPSIVILL